jgi:hypothetical protein
VPMICSGFSSMSARRNFLPAESVIAVSSCGYFFDKLNDAGLCSLSWGRGLG